MVYTASGRYDRCKTTPKCKIECNTTMTVKPKPCCSFGFLRLQEGI